MSLKVVLLFLIIAVFAQFFCDGIPVYWINLNSSTARRAYMEEQFASSKLKSFRVPAINGTNFEDLPIAALEMPCNRNTPKDIACLISHIKAIEAFVRGSTEEFGLIMEDDVELLYDIDFERLIQTAPKSFGILQLVTSNPVAVANLLESYHFSNTSSYWVRNDWDLKTENGKYALFWSAQAYIIRRSVAVDVLSLISVNSNVLLSNPKLCELEKHHSKCYYSLPIFRLGLRRQSIRNNYLPSPLENSVWRKFDTNYLIINSFHSRYCSFVSKRPCVLANCLFSDTYIFSAFGPTYVSSFPLFGGAKVGYRSDLHQDHVYVHKEVFSLIENVYKNISINPPLYCKRMNKQQ